MADKHIVAGSGGFQYIRNAVKYGPIIDYTLKLTGKDRPKFCYIGTAGGDSSIYTKNFYDACSGRNIDAAHLELFPLPNHENIEEFILSQDAIWVSGGSATNLLAVWKVHGLFKILKKAWEQGTVLGGVSAGSLCWNSAGTTDSYGLDLKPMINKDGFLPYSSGVHYDSEDQRRPLFQRLIKDGSIPGGYATDDGVCIHFINEDFHKAVADTEGKFAYRVYKTDNGEVAEEKITPELLNP